MFSHYGIKIDYRHASLVADYLTLQGEFNCLSRQGLKHNSSAFMKMSFETTL